MTAVTTAYAPEAELATAYSFCTLPPLIVPRRLTCLVLLRSRRLRTSYCFVNRLFGSAKSTLLVMLCLCCSTHSAQFALEL